jgi:uncharacterized RDD family membrane protein YckC
VVARIDVNELVRRVDVDDVIARVDINVLLDRITVDDLLDRIDVDRLLDRIDVDGLIRRVDLDELLKRVDLDAVLERIDIDRIVERADLGSIVAQSTRGITASTVDLLRRQIVGVDEVLTRLGARLARRDPDTDPDGPAALLAAIPAPTGRRRAPSISGHYAGPLSRLAAIVLDWFTLVFVFGLAAALATWTVDLVLRRPDTGAPLGAPWGSVLLALWALLYFVVPLAVTGRTFGKAVLGLRVVSRDGTPLHPRQALVRVLILPVSMVFLGLGLVGVVFGRERRTLHDVAARSTEVIDWGDRPAELPGPLNQWLARRQERRAAA